MAVSKLTTTTVVHAKQSHDGVDYLRTQTDITNGIPEIFVLGRGAPDSGLSTVNLKVHTCMYIPIYLFTYLGIYVITHNIK